MSTTTNQKKIQKKKPKFNVIINDLVFEFNDSHTAMSFAELANNHIKGPNNTINIEIK